MNDGLKLIKTVSNDLRGVRNIFIANYTMLKMIYDLLPDDIPLLDVSENKSFKTSTGLKTVIKRNLISQGSLFLDTDIIQRIVRELGK